jgi:hypothetical protein
MIWVLGGLLLFFAFYIKPRGNVVGVVWMLSLLAIAGAMTWLCIR